MVQNQWSEYNTNNIIQVASWHSTNWISCKTVELSPTDTKSIQTINFGALWAVDDWSRPKNQPGFTFFIATNWTGSFYFLHSVPWSSHYNNYKWRRNICLCSSNGQIRGMGTHIQVEKVHQGDFIWFLSGCVMNVLSGVLPINKVELKKFEKPLRKLADRRVEKSERIKIFWSDSGIRLIKLIAFTLYCFSGAKCTLKNLC